MSEVITSEVKIQELLSRSVSRIYPDKNFLEQRLKSGSQLSVYLGIDPTGLDLHLGHSVQLFVLKRFQALGHKVFIVIGGFTAQIGDPTGKDQTRKPLSESEVKENARNYKKQIGKILDLKKTSFVSNSRWLSKLTFKEVIKLASLKTVQQLLDRDMFQKRIAKGEAIGVHEFLYPLMQGYDSVALEIDGEIGGSDQTFNMLVGRDLEKSLLNKEKFVLTTELLVTSKEGGKMSKTEGVFIPLSDSPSNMYAKILSLPDETVFNCFRLCTDTSLDELSRLESINILEAKRRLAYEIVKIYHSSKKASLAQKEFDRVFRGKEIPREIKEFKFEEKEMNVVDLLLKTNMTSHTSQAKRLIQQKAVRINDRVVYNWRKNILLEDGIILRVGPRKFAKIRK